MRSRLLPLAVGLVLLTTACSSGGSGVIAVTDSWAPTTPPSAQAAVVYLTIDNGTGADDQLVSVVSDSCGTIELHATQFDDNRVMRMRLAEPELLRIRAGETMEMIPGGLHVMCIAPIKPFELGDQIQLTATLEIAGEIAITTEVRNR